jgi:hypothetical protein
MHNFREDEKRKTYLNKYNEFINRKRQKSAGQDSYNMMGSTKQSIGLKTIHI